MHQAVSAQREHGVVAGCLRGDLRGVARVCGVDHIECAVIVHVHGQEALDLLGCGRCCPGLRGGVDDDQRFSQVGAGVHQSSGTVAVAASALLASATVASLGAL